MKKEKLVKIKFPLAEEQKQYLKDRLEKVLNRKTGCQIVILWDEEKLTDYYQNICVPHLLKRIEKSAKEYVGITDEKFITLKSK